METAAVNAGLTGEEKEIQKFYESLAETLGYASIFPALVKQWRSRIRTAYQRKSEAACRHLSYS